METALLRLRGVTVPASSHPAVALPGAGGFDSHFPSTAADTASPSPPSPPPSSEKKFQDASGPAPAVPLVGGNGWLVGGGQGFAPVRACIVISSGTVRGATLAKQDLTFAELKMHSDCPPFHLVRAHAWQPTLLFLPCGLNVPNRCVTPPGPRWVRWRPEARHRHRPFGPSRCRLRRRRRRRRRPPSAAGWNACRGAGARGPAHAAVLRGGRACGWGTEAQPGARKNKGGPERRGRGPREVRGAIQTLPHTTTQSRTSARAFKHAHAHLHWR